MPSPTKKHEMTLTVGEGVWIDDSVYLELLPKTHPLAITAQIARFGVIAPMSVKILRGELK